MLIVLMKESNPVTKEETKTSFTIYTGRLEKLSKNILIMSTDIQIHIRETVNFTDLSH